MEDNNLDTKSAVEINETPKENENVEETKEESDLLENKEKDNKKNKKSKKIILISIILLVLIMIGVCLYIFVFNKDNNNSSKKATNVELKKYKSNYEMEDNTLSDFDLYFLKNNNTKNNVVYSPLSIKYALQMISEGADNNTKGQIDAIIGKYSSNKYINSKNMSFANVLFINNKEKKNILDDYKNNISVKYNAEVINDDFKNAKNINGWIKNKTLNLLPDMLTDEDVNGKSFALVNALAIDMEWVKRIQPARDSSESSSIVFYNEVMPENLSNNDAYNYSIHYNNSCEKLIEYYQGIVEENEKGIKFNNTKNVDFSSFSVVANKYDIINVLGEDNIKNTIKDAYIEYIENPKYPEVITEEEKNYKNNNYLDEYIDDYIKELSKNYGKYVKSTDLEFYTDDSYNIFAKDLKKYNGTQLQYVAIMPKKEELDSFISNTDANTLKSLINKLKSVEYETFKEGYLTILTGFVPYFDFDYELDLKDNLKSLGVEDVFDSKKADLSKLSKSQSFIDVMKHQANINFSNEGIKASSISYGYGRGDTCGPEFRYAFEVPTEIIKLEFDKPFMYLIRDKKTGEVWFTGTVYEPTEANN